MTSATGKTIGLAAALAAALLSQAAFPALAGDEPVLSSPIHARFFGGTKRADDFSFYARSVLGQDLDVSGLPPGLGLAMPSEYRGDVGGLLAKVACLNGLELRHAGPGSVRLQEAAKGRTASCTERSA